MLQIYADSNQHEWWISQVVDTDSVAVHRQLNQWLEQDLSNSLATVEILEFSDLESKRVQVICDRAQRAVIFIPELIDKTWLEKFDYPNVTVVIAGIINTIQDREHDDY